jgi:hypothetical protein
VATAAAGCAEGFWGSIVPPAALADAGPAVHPPDRLI